MLYLPFLEYKGLIGVYFFTVLQSSNQTLITKIGKLDYVLWFISVTVVKVVSGV